MQIDIKIDYSKLSKAFDRIPLLAAKELRIALKTSCQAIQRDAKANHRFNSKTNTLENGVGYKVDNTGLSAEIQLNIDGKSTAYAAAIHDGSPPHVIIPKKKKSLCWVNGKKFFSKKVNHPGTKPDQFLYKAAARQKSFVVARINGAYKRIIEMAGLK